MKPYQPPGIWEEATFGNKRYQQDHGEALYRRSLYTFWRRIVGPTMFFDAAARQTCTVKQTRDQHAAARPATLNDATYVEAARVLAAAGDEGRDATTANGSSWRSGWCWPASRRPRRRRCCSPGWSGCGSSSPADPAAAKKLLTVGESKRDETLDAVEHAAYDRRCA